jgi:hypothetical protein
MWAWYPSRQLSTALSALAAPFLGWSLPSATWGQTAQAVNQFHHHCSYGAETPFSAWLKAESEFVRAQGEYNLNSALARTERARAYHLELINWVDQLRAMLERRRIGEAEYDRLHLDHLERHARRVAKTVERIEQFPELSQHSIGTGVPLNFLLEHVVLTGQEPLAVAPLSNSVLEAVRLREQISGGGSVTLTLQAHEPLAVIVWGLPLLDTRLGGVRNRFVAAHHRLIVAAMDGNDIGDLFRVCRAALQSLRTDYERLVAQQNVLESVETHRRHRQAVAQLKLLDRQIGRLAETSGNVLRHVPWRKPPTDLATLVFGMQSRGLEFAPCDPGDEAAYNELFTRLRHLLLEPQRVVADAK